jgi:hypothetical protein
MDSIIYHFKEPKSEETVPWVVVIDASKNTWSRSARRKRKREASPIERHLKAATIAISDPDDSEKTEAANAIPPELLDKLICSISPKPLPPRTNSNAGVTLEAQWIKGDRRSMFEGFWSHVCRKLKEKECLSNK